MRWMNDFLREDHDASGAATAPCRAGVRVLDALQQNAYRELVGQSRAILRSPTGWGKTTVLRAALLARLEADPTFRAVVAVPQWVIAEELLDPIRMAVPGLDERDWQVAPENVLDHGTQRASRVTEWLAAPAAGDASRRVLVLSHTTLARQRLRVRPEHWRNVGLVVDECHHVGGGGQAVANGLGHLAGRLLREDPGGFLLWLATATYGRADRLPIVAEDRVGEFARVQVSFEDFWATRRHLRSFAKDTVLYGEPELDLAWCLLLHDPRCRTLFFAPQEGSPLLRGATKRRLVARFLDCARHKTGAVPWTPGTTADKVSLDLTVADARRVAQLDFLRSHSGRVVVVAVSGMFVEGANWVECNNVIDMQPNRSLPRAIQKFGRLLRDHPGKDHVRYSSVLPIETPTDGDPRQIFNAECCRLLSAMMGAMVFGPAAGKAGGVCLASYFDEGQLQTLAGDVGSCLLNAREAGFDDAAMASALARVFADYGVPPEDAASLADGLVEHGRTAASRSGASYRRATVEDLPTVQAPRLPFPQVELVETNRLADLLVWYTTGRCGMAEIRAVGRNITSDDTKARFLLALKPAVDDFRSRHDGHFPTFDCRKPVLGFPTTWHGVFNRFLARGESFQAWLQANYPDYRRKRAVRSGWTEELDSRLLTESPHALAAELGVDVGTVLGRRRRIAQARGRALPKGQHWRPDSPQTDGIENPGVWTEERMLLLGKMSDQKLAALMGCSYGKVWAMRTRMKIPASQPRCGVRKGRSRKGA